MPKLHIRFLNELFYVEMCDKLAYSWAFAAVNIQQMLQTFKFSTVYGTHFCEIRV